MKKLLLAVVLTFFASPVFADDEDLTIAKMQAQLNALAEQNRELNGKVEDLQHQTQTAPQPAAPLLNSAAFPIQPAQQPVAQMPPPITATQQPTYIPAQPAAQTYTPQPPYDNQQELAPAVAIPQSPAFPHSAEVPDAVPYTPQLQGETVISPKLQQPGTVQPGAVIGADGSVVTKPNPYVTKVTPPPADEESLEDEFDKIFQNVANEDYTTAKPQLKNFIEKHPGTDLAGEAYFWLGEIAWSEKNYNDAVVNYLKGYKEAPKGSKAPENLLKMSLSLKQLGKNAEACKFIARFNTEFPTANQDLKSQAADAKAELGCK